MKQLINATTLIELTSLGDSFFRNSYEDTVYSNPGADELLLLNDDGAEFSIDLALVDRLRVVGEVSSSCDLGLLLKFAEFSIDLTGDCCFTSSNDGSLFFSCSRSL